MIYFERIRSMKKLQISKLKIVDWYLDFTKESQTTLKNVISSFKICFQNYEQLKKKIFEAYATPNVTKYQRFNFIIQIHQFTIKIDKININLLVECVKMV